jgi:hypothetical protein
MVAGRTVNRTANAFHVGAHMPRSLLLATALVLVTSISAGCMFPVPVSTVALQSRAARPFIVQSEPSVNLGTFSSPAFDVAAARIAVFDSGSNRVLILRVSDLTPIDSLKPSRRPSRLLFSPGGRFLAMQSYQGWVEQHLSSRPPTPPPNLDSPDAIRDDIQRSEVWDLETGRTIPDLRCDAEETIPPTGGWLWARRKAITPGYRSSAILLSAFSRDDGVFSIVCHNGVEQRWDTLTWGRLDDIAAPPFWSTLTRQAEAAYWAGNTAAGQSRDGAIGILSVREGRHRRAHLWDRTPSVTREVPGGCNTSSVPVHALSADGGRLLLICAEGVGEALRVWDLGSRQEIALKHASFGMRQGTPVVRAAGVAISPTGRHIAAALLDQAEALAAPGVISRSDLRVWRLDHPGEPATIPIDDLASSADYFRGVDLAFTPDGTVLAIAGRQLRLYRSIDLSATAR